jgi:hypothetical protein
MEVTAGPGRSGIPGRPFSFPFYHQRTAVRPEQRAMQDREASRKAAPAPRCSAGADPRLVALVRLLARHAARQDHDQALRDAANGVNSEGTAPEIEP